MYLLANNASSPLLDVPGWAQFGLAGIVIAVLFWMLHRRDERHTQERESWRSDMVKLADKQTEAQEKTADKFVGLHQDMLRQLTNKQSDDK